jgi:hypothetical protein
MTLRKPLFVLLALILSLGVPASSVRAEDEPVKDEEAEPAPKKKAPAKRKPYDYDRSKYKSRELSQTPTYRFNERGEPINAETKKKAPVKKKKRSEPPEAGLDGPGSCGLAADSCVEKKTEADAL